MPARTPRPCGRRSAVVALAALPLLLGGCGLGGGGADPTTSTTSSGSTSTAPTGSSTGSASSAGSASSSGSSSSTPDGVSVAEIFGAARTTAGAATSGRVLGTLTSEGEKVVIDLAGATDGTNQRLRLTTTDGTVTVYTVAGRFYLVADKDYWSKNVGDTAADQLAGKYVLMSEEDASSFGAYTIVALLQEMFGNTELSPLDAIRTVVTPTTRNGEQVYVLTDRLSDTGRVVVTADGKAELRLLQVGGADPAVLAFGSWNAVPPVKPPAAKDVVKL